MRNWLEKIKDTDVPERIENALERKMKKKHVNMVDWDLWKITWNNTAE